MSQGSKLSDELNSLKKLFIIVGNKASTGDFNLNDLPGSGGRMDIICRFIAQSLFISHGIREDSGVITILLGEPDPPRSIFVHGGKVRYMSPDERNVAGLIRKALRHKSEEWKETSPGIFIAKKSINEVLSDLNDFSMFYLREDGRDIFDLSNEPEEKMAFIIGDHLGVKEDIEELILKKVKETISVSPLSLQADQCVVIIHNFLDRLEELEC
jgi:tRNA (pseudouridine54-N1)-methyltransferase